MSYCTVQNLIDRYSENELIQLSDNDNLGQVNEVVIDQSIADASSLIDGYLGGRYALPITPVPLSLVRIASELTRYYLQKGVIQDDVEKRYQNTIKTLEKIASGTLSIGITATGDKPASQNTVQMTSGGNVFSRRDKSFL